MHLNQYWVLSAAFVSSASMRNFTYKKLMILIMLVIVSCVLSRDYRYAPHNDVSVNDGPLILQWSHKIMIS
jgi:hypothetical protein